MKTFDELLAMTEEERSAYSAEEVEKVISSADSKNVLKLRRLQSKIDHVKKHTVDPLARTSKIYGMMLDSMFELNEHLKHFRTKP